MSNVVNLAAYRAARAERVGIAMERVQVHNLLERLAEELTFEAYRMLTEGAVLGRKASHDVAMEFSGLVADSLRDGFMDLEQQAYG